MAALRLGSGYTNGLPFPQPEASCLSSKVLEVLIAGLDHVLALFGERSPVELLTWPQSLDG
jgi:hypothetical protein